MQLEATDAVMGAFQEAASGLPNGLKHLASAVRRHAGRKAIMTNLFGTYLPAYHLALGLEVEQAVQNMPAIPLRQTTKSTNTASESTPAPASPWEKRGATWWDRK